MKKVDKWTGEETIKISEVIDTLNEIADLDPKLANKFVCDRFPCNHSIRDHETIQVHCYGNASVSHPKVSLLGILNGLFGIDNNHFGGIIAIVGTEKGEVISFHHVCFGTDCKDYKNKYNFKKENVK